MLIMVLKIYYDWYLVCIYEADQMENQYKSLILRGEIHRIVVFDLGLLRQ